MLLLDFFLKQEKKYRRVSFCLTPVKLMFFSGHRVSFYLTGTGFCMTLMIMVTEFPPRASDFILFSTTMNRSQSPAMFSSLIFSSPDSFSSRWHRWFFGIDLNVPLTIILSCYPFCSVDFVLIEDGWRWTDQQLTTFSFQHEKAQNIVSLRWQFIHILLSDRV